MPENGVRRLCEVASRVALVCRFLDDLSTPGSSDQGAEEGFPAASVIKIGIMSALVNGVVNGDWKLSDRLTISAEQQVGGAGVLFELEPERDFSLAELCRLMMVVSDNTASNALARLVGLERLTSFWGERGYQSSMKRFFMEPATPSRDNQTTALGIARMLRDLYLGSDLDEDLKGFALGCLRRQQYREKIPRMLPHDLLVGHKTGELDGVRHDAAVIETERPYVLVVLTAEGAVPWLVDDAIAAVSFGLFKGFAKSR